MGSGEEAGEEEEIEKEQEQQEEEKNKVKEKKWEEELEAVIEEKQRIAYFMVLMTSLVKRFEAAACSTSQTVLSLENTLCRKLQGSLQLLGNPS